MNQEGMKARLERFVREINAAQSKAIILKNDLFNDFELEDFEERYVDSLRERDEHARNDEYMDERYFTKLCDDINDVIEANDKLLAHLYAAKRSYASVPVRNNRNWIGF